MRNSKARCIADYNSSVRDTPTTILRSYVFVNDLLSREEKIADVVAS